MIYTFDSDVNSESSEIKSDVRPPLNLLRALSDPTRLRIVALLEKDELSVNELQEITRMGQSRISTHLGCCRIPDLLQSRREGKRTFYKLNQAADATAQRIHPARHSGREGIGRTRRATRSI